MKTGLKIKCAQMAVVLAAIPVIVHGYEFGPNPSYTGAPGDNATACVSAGCHVGTVNSGPGNVKIVLPSGNSGSYVPGQAMQILVQITDSSKSAYGFQLTARMGSGNKTQAGDFSTTDGNTQVLCQDGSTKANGGACPTSFPIQDIEHTTTGYEASIKSTPKGTYTYTVNWTPPAAGSGKVMLYVAANCGPGDPPVQTPTNVYTANVALTESASTPTPSINPGGIGPVYSKATTIQPGSWISIYGQNLVSSLGVWDGTPPTPTSLGGASVTINGKPGYLWVAVPKAFGNTDQINVQAPDDTQTGTVNVVVTNTTNGSATSTVTLDKVAPSFSVLGDGAHAAAIIFDTGAINGPGGNAFPYATSPIKAGQILELYGVGFGPTTPFVPAGQPYSGFASVTQQTQATFQLLIGGVSISQDNILAGGIIGQGLYQFNVKIPPGLGTGDKSLTAIVQGVSTPTGVVISLQ